MKEHNLTSDDLKKIPELLANPEYVFESKTDEKAFVAIVDKNIEPYTVVVSYVGNGLKIKNIIKSAYNKDANFIKRETNAGRLLYDKNSLQEGESETKSGAIEEAININITPSGRDVNSPRYQTEEYDEQLEADLAEFDKILDSFAEENKEYYSKKGKFEDAKKIQKKYKDFFMYNIADASVSTALHDPFYFEYDGQKDITNIWIPKKLEKNSNIILYRYAEQISIPVNKFEKSKFKKLGFKRQKLYDEGMRDIYTLNKEEKSDDARDFVRENGKYIRKPSAYYQTAYAGSRVDYDKPSLEAIGTGEGHQAHGWGLYYALSRDTAERYREYFDLDNYFFDEEALENERAKAEKEAGKTKDYSKVELLEDLLVQHNESNLSNYPEDLVEWYNKNIRNKVLNKDYKKTQVHEVDIPENPYLLDEQKPFSEQSDIVKKGIIDTLNSMSLTEKQKEKFRNNIENRRDTGKEIYDELVVAMGTSKGDGLISSSKENMPLVSKALSENGVKGITYEGRQDGRCFVIFNPKDVKVIQKFYQTQAEGGINLEVGGGRKPLKPYKRHPLKVMGQYEPTKKMITLFKGRNPTTLVHEMGHHYLPIHLRLLEKAGKWDKLKPLYKELGISSVEQMNREAEEKLIDMFTSYIYYNEAPNVETQSIFERAKQWMINAYNTVKNFVKPSEEVTKFFDELIAGEENAPDVSHKNKNRSFYERFFAKIMYICSLKVPTNSILFIYTIFSSFRCCNYTGKSGSPS
ncbi:MAG: hypothetical protein J6K16_00630 [Alphaproteobacteria bacterium]|nr:hypothetical protein [Alphaproteobacteria bacterium]